VIQITDLGSALSVVSRDSVSQMDEALIAVFKKVITEGKEAGLTIDQIFDLLETGMVIGTVLNLIELRLSGPAEPRSSRWVM